MGPPWYPSDPSSCGPAEDLMGWVERFFSGAKFTKPVNRRWNITIFHGKITIFHGKITIVSVQFFWNPTKSPCVLFPVVLLNCFLGPESTWNFHNIGIRRGRFWYGWSPDIWEEHYGMTREKHMAKNIRWLCMKIDFQIDTSAVLDYIGYIYIYCIHIYILHGTNFGKWIGTNDTVFCASATGKPLWASQFWIHFERSPKFMGRCVLRPLQNSWPTRCWPLLYSYLVWVIHSIHACCIFVMDSRWFTMRQLVNKSGCQAVI